MPRGMVMLDTGCKRAVGGSAWHASLQDELDKRMLKYDCIYRREYFKFGPGDPILSPRAWRYPVGVNGVMGELIMAEVEAEVPGLVGPGEISELDLSISVKEGTFAANGLREPHPV